MLIEVKAITEALQYRHAKEYRRAIIATDSKSTLQKKNQQGKPILCLYVDWGPVISSSKIERLICVLSTSHAGVQGNERGYSLAVTAAIDNYITIDPPTVIQCVTEQLMAR